jgi:hypothetical protein
VPGTGPAVSDPSFHHFCDYNWDPRKGAPTFVTEPPGDGVLDSPNSLDDTHRYVENIAARRQCAEAARRDRYGRVGSGQFPAPSLRHWQP